MFGGYSRGVRRVFGRNLVGNSWENSGRNSEKFREKSGNFINRDPLSGYWKATGPNKFIGRGTQVADFCRGFSKGIFPTFLDFFFENFGKNHLENPLQKSATCAPLPINVFGPVAFQ